MAFTVPLWGGQICIVHDTVISFGVYQGLQKTTGYMPWDLLTYAKLPGYLYPLCLDLGILDLAV